MSEARDHGENLIELLRVEAVAKSFCGVWLLHGSFVLRSRASSLLSFV